MKTLALSLAILIAPTTARAENPDIDLDRVITLAQAQRMMDTRPAPKAPALPVATSKPVAGVLVAICNDGLSYYHVTGERRGACSGHRGVASWADGSPVTSRTRQTSYR